MASITSWVRLEPRARGGDLLSGAEARIHDPLWLLARQSQMRELVGTDGGSSISAQARLEVSRLDGVRAPGADWSPFDPDRTPLDAALAPSNDEPRARPALAARARAGRQLLRMLAHAGAEDAVPTFLDRFRFDVAIDELQLLDADDRRFLATMGARAPDGDLAATTLAPLLAAGDLPAAFGLAPSIVAIASQVARSWLSWRASLARSLPAATWRPERNDYQFDLRTSSPGRELTLAVSHHDARPVRWYDAVVAENGPPPEALPPVIVTAIPSRVRYRGMPARRYWDLEDGAVHWPSIDAGPGDVGRMMLVEIALTLADHWLTIPVELRAGSIARTYSLVVTDTFGSRAVVRSAADLDGNAGPWRFCELSRRSSVPGPLLLILPAASEPLVGTPVEAFDLARDEVSNVVWAIERTRLGADDRPREVRPVSPPTPSPGEPALRYRVGPDVPTGYHPYVTREGSEGLEVARARIPGTSVADEPSSLPARLVIAAVPRTARQLQQVDELTRATDGSYHLIRRRAVVPVAPRQGVTLQFDQLVGGKAPE